MLNTQEELRFCKARRAAIELEFGNLNPEQRKAALATEGPLLLLAGAGSGKTTVLIHRIANLMKYGRGADSDEVPAWVTPAELDFLEEYVRHPDPSQKAEQERLRAEGVRSSNMTLARLCPYCDHKIEILFRGSHGYSFIKCPNCGENVGSPPVSFRRA